MSRSRWQRIAMLLRAWLSTGHKPMSGTRVARHVYRLRTHDGSPQNSGGRKHNGGTRARGWIPAERSRIGRQWCERKREGVNNSAAPFLKIRIVNFENRVTDWVYRLGIGSLARRRMVHATPDAILCTT